MTGDTYNDPACARVPDPIPGEGNVRMSLSDGGNVQMTLSPEGGVRPALPGESYVRSSSTAEGGASPSLQADAEGEEGPSACSFRAFGTLVDVVAYGDASACRAAFDAVVAACRAYERRLSTRLPHSDIALLNAAGGRARAVHPDTAELIVQAKRYCALSEGAFDMTVQPAVRLWDFQRGIVPEPDELAEAVRHIDWRGVDVFEKGGMWFACLADSAAQVDLGGIAKGWIADCLVELLEQGADGVGASGLASFCVNLGGNVAVRGPKPDGSPWSVGVRDPAHPASMLATAEVANGAVVTSGTYERCFKKDGRLYHHVLDPATGMPVETDLASATAIARTALDAEGFSTTLLALGMKRACAFVQCEPSISSAILISNGGHVQVVSE